MSFLIFSKVHQILLPIQKNLLIKIKIFRAKKIKILANSKKIITKKNNYIKKTIIIINNNN
jgi:hypothetical protein